MSLAKIDQKMFWALVLKNKIPQLSIPFGYSVFSIDPRKSPVPLNFPNKVYPKTYTNLTSLLFKHLVIRTLFVVPLR